MKSSFLEWKEAEKVKVKNVTGRKNYVQECTVKLGRHEREEKAFEIVWRTLAFRDADDFV